MNSIIVKKLGWENSAELQGTFENIEKDFSNNKKQVIVLSALKADGNVANFEFNVTRKLITLWESIVIGTEEKNNEALWLVEEIRNFHIEMIEEKLWKRSKEPIQYVKETFKNLKEEINHYIKGDEKSIIPSKENDYSINTRSNTPLSLLWLWENLAARILQRTIAAFNIQGLQSEVVDTSNLLLNKKLCDLSEAEIFDALTLMLGQRIHSILEKNKSPVIPGFINNYPGWILNIVWFWYTDATKSIAWVWSDNSWYQVKMEVQKYVDGFRSADPRIIKSGTKVIPNLDYATAIESISSNGADAKLLNEQSLRGKVQLAWIPVKIYNPFNDSKWTIIDKDGDKDAIWVQAVLWRKESISVSVNSPISWVWFTEKVSSITREVWIDMYEQSGSVTDSTFWMWKDNEDKLPELLDKMQDKLNLYSEEGWRYVNVYKDRSVVFCIWQNMNWPGISGRAGMILAMNGIGIKSSSQWETQKAISYTIDSKDYDKAINVLHEEFIVKSKLKHLIPLQK